MSASFAELSRDAVNERFDWARRRGQANWLWPDVSIESWRDASKDIADAVRGLLAGKSGVALDCGNAQAMSVAAYTSGMGPLLGCWIESGLLRVSDSVGETLRLHLSENRQRMLGLSSVARSVIGKLAEQDIRPLVVKGMHTAFRYFPEPGARSVSDIDLVIPMKSMPAAERVFADLGYNRIFRMQAPYACDWVLPAVSNTPRTLMYVHRDDPWSFDVQGSLNRRLLTGALVMLDKLSPPTDVVHWPLSSEASVLPQPLLALHLAAHISQILLSATLLRVTELVLVIRTDEASGLFCWQEFLHGARTIGSRFVYPALIFCEQLAPGTVPPDVLAACAEDAPGNLRDIMSRLTIDSAQPLGRYSIRERFMWAGNWTERAKQIAGELAIDGRRQPLGRTLYSIGTKLWALRHGRYTA
jgi:Uncharacterised nucleotidyltransferase